MNDEAWRSRCCGGMSDDDELNGKTGGLDIYRDKGISNGDIYEAFKRKRPMRRMRALFPDDYRPDNLDWKPTAANLRRAGS